MILVKGKAALQFDFFDKAGRQYSIDIKYKNLPTNHAFPNILHITLDKIVVKNYYSRFQQQSINSFKFY